MIVYYIFAFAYGLIVGSFINVLIFRLGVKEGIINGRSECPRCLKKLAWYDLIPLLSYFQLAGKCRYCKGKISFIYPIVEAAAGLLFLAIVMIRGPSLNAEIIFMAIISTFVIAIIFFDILYLIIPDKVVFPLITLALVYDIAFRRADMAGLLLSGFLLASFFATLYVVSQGTWMGLGDAKLVFLIGIVLGYPLSLMSVICAVWVAALYGIGLVVAGKATGKTAVPFGSFLGSSLIIFILFQYEIQNKIKFFERFF